MNKKQLRVEIKERLDLISDASLMQWSEYVSVNLSTLISKLKSKTLSECTIGCFCPMQKEPIWYLKFSSQLSYALVQTHDGRKLTYYRESLASIEAGSADGSGKEIVPDILLVPGLAFTESGERLGRGKGYFDSYLANFSGVKIGVGFECQFVADVYSEAHDEKLDYLITEKNIYDVR